MFLHSTTSDVRGASLAGRCLYRLVAEALPAESRGGLRPRPETGDEPSSPLALGLELRDRVGRLGLRETVLLEEVTDALVAVPALGEGGRPRACVSAVVEVADPFEGLERLCAPGVVHPGSRKPLVELAA